MTIRILLGALRKFTPNGQRQAIKVLQFIKQNGGCEIADLPRGLEFLGKKKYFEKQIVNKKESIESIVKGFVSDVKTKGVARRTGTILNTKSGIQEPISIRIPTGLTKESEFLIEACNIDGTRIGLVKLKPHPNNAIYDDINKHSLYIDFFSTAPGYKGIGTEMLKKIVKLSNQFGYKGRVSLQACTGSLPDEYRVISRDKILDGSCALKYAKMGFKSTRPEINAKIEETIRNGGDGILHKKGSIYGEKYGEDLLSGPMYLPDESIKKYLRFNSQA